MYRFLSIPLLLPFLGPLGAVDPPAAGPSVEVKTEWGVEYATAGGEKLRLDLAVPPGPGPHPCVLCLHGGAWRAGSRRDLSRPGTDDKGKPTPSLIETLAARGYVTASADYRLAPKYKFPAQLEDARAAIRFLRANAKKYHLDPDRVGVVGFSAGGHLALLLGLDAAPDPKEDGRVACVVDFFGPTDLSLYAASPGLEDAYMVPFLGKECRTDPAVYKRASPIEYASKDAPPVLIVHGTADIIVPVIHSERLYKKLTEAGATAELITVRGEGHGWFGPAAKKSTDDAVAFLDKHLKGKK